MFMQQIIDISFSTVINKAIRDGNYIARHMPVLGNVHPENLDIFSWRHFSARTSCLFYY